MTEQTALKTNTKLSTPTLRGEVLPSFSSHAPAREEGEDEGRAPGRTISGGWAGKAAGRGGESAGDGDVPEGKEPCVRTVTSVMSWQYCAWKGSGKWRCKRGGSKRGSEVTVTVDGGLGCPGKMDWGI